MPGTNPNTGLSESEVRQRTENGQANSGFTAKTKSVSRILCENVFTLFNLINIVLAILVISVGSIRNALFMGVVLCNTAIGIFQEIRAKRAIDRLSVISEPKAEVIRDGSRKAISADDVVIGDIMLLSAGMQICADGVILEGECETNESLITGESDTIYKSFQSEVFSGSYVTAGFAKAEVTRVGADSMSGRITSAKYHKKPSSDMTNAINRIIRILSFIIIPYGAIMLAKAFLVVKSSPEAGITGTVAALIGMIPEGLVLLTGIALAVSVIRLSRHNTLCRDLYCVEQLARVDVLCIDKTGTLTEGKMNVSGLIPIDEGFDTEAALADFTSAFPEKNSTMKAIAERFPAANSDKVIKTIPFSSARKFSAVQLEKSRTLVLGAAEYIRPQNYEEIREKCEVLYSEGNRVLILCRSESPIADNTLPDDLTVKAIVALSDVIRPTAPKTLEYFASQGVAVKIISGDALSAVVNIARRVGLPDAANAVDMSEIPDERIPDICEKYSVFCRTTPEQKLNLVKSLKNAGHKTAMTGDGVNDVLALREADCSIAMSSGSDAARTVSQVVLLNSDFSSVPMVVEEGRRCINNIQRSAALFLSKTVFSVLLTTVYLFLPLNYPLMPIQLTLISACAIGIPSFFLALEANKSRVVGNFLKNVLTKALPGGISAAAGVASLNILDAIFKLSDTELTTIAAFVTAAAFFGVLWHTCRPFNKRQGVLFAFTAGIFSLAAVFLNKLFFLVRLSDLGTVLLICSAAVVLLFQAALVRILERR